MDKIIALLARINSALLMLCRYCVIFIVALLALILTASVVYRYGLNSALSWAEEVCKYLMVWLTFTGTPIVLQQHGHVNIDLLLKKLPGRAQQLLYFLVCLVICFTMAIVFSKGLDFSAQGARQVASSFNLSMFYMYIAVPIGAALTFLVALEQALRAVRGVLDPQQGFKAWH